MARILLSAYACEPDRGSEPGVGWHWAIELANLGHEVHVLTQGKHRPFVERELAARPRANLTFTFVELPGWLRGWKTEDRGERTYHFLWQLAAYLAARGLVRRQAFDWVHHVTYGAFRYPTGQAFLGRPFVFGPIGGGEQAPWRLRKSFPWRGKIVDALRDLSTAQSMADPIVLGIFRRSDLILCKNRDTYRAIPERFRARCRVQLEVGISAVNPPEATPREDDALRLLFVGRHVYWKGAHLALMSFARLKRTHPEARLTMVGSGPDHAWLRGLARRLGIDDQVDWKAWMPKSEVLELYRAHDVFLFPSLHDSSGNVVLEALASGLPVVCLDLAGPAMLVDDTCGRVIATAGRSEDEVVAALSEACETLANDPSERARLGRNACERAGQFLWPDVVARTYALIEQWLGTRRGACAPSL